MAKRGVQAVGKTYATFCSLSVVASEAPSRNGRIEKNLCRQGSQRNDGKPSKRPTLPRKPGTCSGEIRFNSKLPQIAQCAYFA
jgi:hypothetical protein